ncbi:hypothetical protein ACGFLS_07180 [Streptomyces abikoensis]|uniref:hypothetical protein n=1 Tax=Streptomyces abikoensis TaxID=97398 RepID=UPI0037229FEA
MNKAEAVGPVPGTDDVLASRPDPEVPRPEPGYDPPAHAQAGREPHLRPPDQHRVGRPHAVLPAPQAKPYAPIAALTLPGQPSIASVANLFSNPSGPMYFHQRLEVRTTDLLETFPVSRMGIVSDASYVDPREWREARQHAAKTLPETPVVLLVSPRQHGVTTFSLRMLAEETDEAVDLHVVEANWDRPLISKLPAQEKCAYVLDLQDPQRDRIDKAFLTGLQKHAETLSGIGSCLVITLTPELWAPIAGQVPDGVAVVRLSAHPRAHLVARQHLIARGQATLLGYVDDPAVKSGIADWTPVRAVWLVEEMIALAAADARNSAEEGTTGEERESRLRPAVRELAKGWGTDLAIRFGDVGANGEGAPGTSLERVRPLSFEDRCLSLALAVRRSGPAARIHADAGRLAEILAGASGLNGKKGAEDKETVDLREVLSGVGLRTRFNSIGADVRYGQARFTSVNYGDSLLNYVWDQYHPLHKRLIRWMVACGADSGVTADDPAVRTILGVLAYHQDDSQLAEVRDQAASLGKTPVATAVMAGAARDEHLGRRARQLLYVWAGHSTEETLRLVVAACRELITDQPGPAVTRLRRVADNPAGRALDSVVLDAFKAVAADQRLTHGFAKAVAEWHAQSAEAGSPAANLGTLALMSVNEPGTQGHPWLLTGDRPIALSLAPALRRLLTDLDRYPGVLDEITRWLGVNSGALHERVMDVVQEAASGRVGITAIITLIESLNEFRGPDGRGAGARLQHDIDTDPDLGGIPLGAYTA